MNLHRTIFRQRLVIVLLLVLTIFITLCCYKYEIEIIEVKRENGDLRNIIEVLESREKTRDVKK